MVQFHGTLSWYTSMVDIHGGMLPWLATFVEWKKSRMANIAKNIEPMHSRPKYFLNVTPLTGTKVMNGV